MLLVKIKTASLADQPKILFGRINRVLQLADLNLAQMDFECITSVSQMRYEKRDEFVLRIYL